MKFMYKTVFLDSKLRHGKQHSSLNKGNELDSMGKLTGSDIDGFKIVDEHNQNTLIAAQNKIK